MLQRLRRLALGIALIAAASAVLVLTDQSGGRRREPSAAVRSARIAIIQFTNIAAFEVGAAGTIEHLKRAGYSKELGSTIDIFNPSGDMATLSQMCAQIATANPAYDLVISLGTAATQSYVRANTRGTPQTMGFVASPPAIRIPLGAYEEGSERPASLAGFGCMQPIESLFRALLACDPAAKRIGVVYNPAEPNAEASMKLARALAPTLGLELVEANGSTVTDAVSAADVVFSRNIDAYWILADTVQNSAAPTTIRHARERGIPIITNFPELAAQGAALSIGADWAACGTCTGMYAELLLRGTDPRTLPIEDFVPERTTLNLASVPARWRVPDALTTRASEIHLSGLPPRLQSVEIPQAPASVLAALAALRQADASSAADNAARNPTAKPTIALLTYNRTPNFEDCYAGFTSEWTRLGYIDGQNCVMKLRDAQFDSGTLNTLAATIAEERPDLLVTFTTPALQAALRRRPEQRIVFSLCASGVIAGAGKSESDHLPNVTGAEVGADWTRMIEIARAALPRVKRVGTVYSPGEVNSVHFQKIWKQRLAEAGIELVSVGADKPTELPEAADALVTLGIDAVLQISDNSSSTGFRVITRAADRANIPVFGFAPAAVRMGATLSVARDYAEVGRLSARLADRVLRGASPGAIPFEQPPDTVVTVNPERLSRFGITLPKAMLDAARVERESAEGAAK